MLPPLPPADWEARWTSSVRSAQAQQDAAFHELGSVIVVLTGVGVLVALVSFVGLLLGAASAQRRELATRAALGAAPRSLAGRLVMQALMLGGLALVAGVMLGTVAVIFTEQSWPHELVEASAGNTLVRMIGAGSLVMAIGVISASVLAYLTVVRGPLAAALTSGARVTASRGELQLRNALAVLQFAGVLALLSGAVSLARESRPDVTPATTGYGSLLIARLELNGSGLREPQERVRQIGALRTRVRSLPGVEAESLASAGAWLGLGPTDRVMVECGKCYRALMFMPYDALRLRQFTIMPGFFAVLGMQVDKGRALEPADDESSERVALVNRPLGIAHFQDARPIGRHAHPYESLTRHEIVGIVPAVWAPVLGGARRLDTALYLSALQHPPRTLDLLVRSHNVQKATDALSGLRAQLPAGVVLHEPQTAVAALHELGAPLRFMAALLLGVALLVVLLGAHGAYALQRFRVENQRHELSVRLALGSSPRSLIRHVLGHTARLVRVAVIVGSLGALAAARSVQLVIPGAPPFAPGMLIAITLLLFTAALLGALLPALRAARLDHAAVLD